MARTSRSCPTARPVRITAQLQQGASLDSRWPQLLDGLLAAVWIESTPAFSHWRRGGQLYNPRLPLRTRKSGHRWTWRASAARPVGTSADDLHWWHKRPPDRAALVDISDGRAARNVGQVGRMRAYRAPLPVTVAAALEWHAWADPRAVETMLQRVWSVGAKRGQGEGAVLEWHVEDVTPDDPESWGLWWPDTGRAARPMYAAAAAPPDMTVTASIRPPYWHPARQVTVWAPHVTIDDARQVTGASPHDPPPFAG